MGARIGVTLGDPTGIGPELVAAVLAEPDGARGAEVIVYGDRGVLARAAALRGVAEPRAIEEITRLSPIVPGRPDRESGRAQVAYLEAAAADATKGRLDAIVTAPIHKASALAAGFAFPGHTEFFAARLAPAGAPPWPVTMMFAGPRLKVALATVHRALASVPEALTVPLLRGTIARTAQALTRDFGIARPRIAVAGLNPHASESGLFGDEEGRVIAPALVDGADFAGARVSGPHVPDAVFRDHLDGKYDAVVALYHDQGLIPVKLIDFEESVNLTLGLPLIRTSPDHGVAHDIAGKGTARLASFRAALRLAVKLVETRKKSPPPMV